MEKAIGEHVNMSDSVFPILKLPQEVVELILRFSSTKDVSSFAQTCKECMMLSRGNSVWKQRLYDDFGIACVVRLPRSSSSSTCQRMSQARKLVIYCHVDASVRSRVVRGIRNDRTCLVQYSPPHHGFARLYLGVTTFGMTYNLRYQGLYTDGGVDDYPERPVRFLTPLRSIHCKHQQTEYFDTRTSDIS